jgi:uncharacterized protein DUF3108
LVFKFNYKSITIMKKLFLISALVFFSLGSIAQCNQFYNLKNGTNWTISNYDAKGKLQSKTIQKVSAYKESSSGFEATFDITSVDKKGEQTLAGSSTITCENGVVYFDMNDMFPDETIESMQSFEMTIDGTNLELPNNLEAGQVLKDANINLRIEAAPMQMNFKIDVTDRKVLAEENIKTPAGDFSCFKITQKIYMKTIGKIEVNSIEWYAKGVGMVKSESYNKKGKLSAYSILTAYSY